MTNLPDVPSGFEDYETSTTVADLLLARVGDEHLGLVFEDRSWTWDAHVRECITRAAWLTARRRPGPFHVGVLLDNVPEFSFLLGGAAFSGAVLVGINSTRRGAELAADLARTDCQLLITDDRGVGLLAGVELPVPLDRVVNIDDSAYAAELGTYAASPLSDVRPAGGDLLMLVFTSGTGGTPKAVQVTHRKVSGPGEQIARLDGIRRDDVAYLSMPLFHSACLMAAWAPALTVGATMVLRRRFSASEFLPDVRRYGATWMHYVGKALAYVLATPERIDDAASPLRLARGNEASAHDMERFGARFGCDVWDGFGSSEGGVHTIRTDDTPLASIGVLPPGVRVLDQRSGVDVQPARFEGDRLVNPREAIGELVNTNGAGGFEGYYNDPEATAERLRGGWYWSGDLAYVDEAGFVFYAGRSGDWLRVDGENLATGPIERVIARFVPAALVAVYAVPDAIAGDAVMVSMRIREDQRFDPEDFFDFLAAQSDLGTKVAPLYVRTVTEMPATATNKTLKRVLRQEAWNTKDPVWWRERRDEPFRAMTDLDRSALRDRFATAGRVAMLGPDPDRSRPEEGAAQ